MDKIKKISRKKLLGCAAAIVLLLACGIWFFTSAVEAEIYTVSSGEVVKLVKESGSVESHSSIGIYAKTTGDIKGLLVSEGDNVEAGEYLLTRDSESSVQMDVKSVEAQAGALAAQYNQAKETADKNKLLYEQGALSYDAYSRSEAAAKQLGLEMAALQYSAESLAKATGADGIVAPMGGIITGVFVKEGETVMAGAQLFEISNLDDIYVKTELMSEDADRIEVGDRVRVYNEDANLDDASARIEKVHLKAQETMSELGIYQKRVTVEIALSEGIKARLGSDVDVEIISDIRENVLRVPKEAIFQIDGEDYLYTVEGGKAVPRAVETGLEGEDYIEIKSGLAENETVIISPDDKITEGVRIKSVQ